jgi:HlyD family secretion protein
VEVDAYPGKQFYGKVSEIAYSANMAGVASTDQVTNFEVRVHISPASYRDLVKPEAGGPESPFRPGMTSLVEIYTAEVKGALAVPIQAVTLRKQEGAEGVGQEVVFRYRNGKAEQLSVSTGINDDAFIEIKSGEISPGDSLITGPYSLLSQRLRDQQEVQPAPPRKDAKASPEKP